MENTLEKVFINKNLGIKFNSYIDNKLRVWFQAKQIASILGYSDTNQAIRKHVSENHKRTFLFCSPVETTGQQIDTRGKYCLFVDEAGFYELVFSSRLPAAKFFREWVLTKVLPSIRKYGYYKLGDKRIKQRVIIDGVKYYKHPVFSNYAARKNGDILSLKNKKIIKMVKSSGYLNFTIYDKKLEKRINYLQHRFVYEVFRGPIPRRFEIDHINEIKTDNRLKNLQLLTHKQNAEKSNNKAIISINIKDGKERRFISIKKAAKELDINSTYISNICCKRKSYKTATSKKDNQKYTFRYL